MLSLNKGNSVAPLTSKNHDAKTSKHDIANDLSKESVSSSCPPSPRPQFKTTESSIEEPISLNTNILGDKRSKRASTVGSEYTNNSRNINRNSAHERNSSLIDGSIMLAEIPTPEAIAGLSQELDDLEKSLIGIETDDQSLASLPISPSLVSRAYSIKSGVGSRNGNRLSKALKDSALLKQVMKENARLLKKVDRYEHELSRNSNQIQSLSLKHKYDQSGGSVEEDVPVAVLALKAKVEESDTIISQQRVQLELQDTKIQELELQLRNQNDTLITKHLLQSRSNTGSTLAPTSPMPRDSILMINDRHISSFLNSYPRLTGAFNGNLDESAVRGFISELFPSSKASDTISEISKSSVTQSIQSPVIVSETGKQSPVPIYTTGLLEEPLSQVRLSVLASPTTLTRSPSINQIVRSMSISSLAHDSPPARRVGHRKRGSISSNGTQSRVGTPISMMSLRRRNPQHTPQSSIGSSYNNLRKNQPSLRHRSSRVNSSAEAESPSTSEAMHAMETRSLEATVKSLETALEVSYQQQTNLHASITQLRMQAENLELNDARVRESHRQAMDALMDQIERSKLEAASYQRQVQELTRNNLQLTSQLEDLNTKFEELENRPRFLCF